MPAPAMTLPPPAEVPYSEIQKLITVGAKYGIEFVLPKAASQQESYALIAD